MNAIIPSAIWGIVMMFSGAFLKSKAAPKYLALIGIAVIFIANALELNSGFRMFQIDTHGMLQTSSFNLTFIAIALLCSALFFLLNGKDFEKVGSHVGEYFALIFFILCGVSLSATFNTLLLLAMLVREGAFQKRALVLVFEGHDAAGKGGAIRRVTASLDARRYRIVPISAPSDEERAQPYMWRFWRQLPHRGRVVFFDRSWYGRVLVERVEGYCSEADWMRAYSEINDFEDEVIAAGAIVVKFWLAISQDVQLERFKERESLPHKRFKITEDDRRNRDKWDQYGARGVRHDRSDQHRECAVDAGRGEQQVLRARQGAAYHLRAARSGARAMKRAQIIKRVTHLA